MTTDHLTVCTGVSQGGVVSYNPPQLKIVNYNPPKKGTDISKRYCCIFFLKNTSTIL